MGGLEACYVCKDIKRIRTSSIYILQLHSQTALLKDSWRSVKVKKNNFVKKLLKCVNEVPKSSHNYCDYEPLKTKTDFYYLKPNYLKRKKYKISRSYLSFFILLFFFITLLTIILVLIETQSKAPLNGPLAQSSMLYHVFIIIPLI